MIEAFKHYSQGKTLSYRTEKFYSLCRAARDQSTDWLRMVVAAPGPQQSKLATLACVKILRERGECK